MKTLFVNNTRPAAAQLVGGVNTVQLFLNSQSSAAPAMLAIQPGSSKVNDTEIQVNAAGNVVTAGAYTVIVGLYAAIAIPAAPTVAANWTLIGASTARAVGTTDAPFLYKARLIMSGASGKLQGTFRAMINNLYDAEAAITNVIPAVNFVNGFYFALGVTFSTGSAANFANLKDFALEL